MQVRVSPLLGYVAAVEMLAPAPASAASEPGVAHALIDDTLTAAGTGLAAGLDGVLARGAEITDDDGRSILEQTDEDGVALRQRLQEGREQLDRSIPSTPPSQ